MTAGFAQPIERAIVGGFTADRLGYVFLSGYEEALRQLLSGPPLPPGLGMELKNQPIALCATEEGGAHPRAIKTQLTPLDGEHGGWELSGHKKFVSLGSLARVLLILASEGPDPQQPERSRLAMVRIPVERAGVVICPQPELPFVPEIPHASVELHKVVVTAAERLPGDGYERYLKPFRTVEDCHVLSSVLGWLVQVARRGAWPAAIVQELLMLAAAGIALAGAPPLDPGVHIALGGWLARIERLLADCEPLFSSPSSSLDAETRSRWERDRPLLHVAGKVRARRLLAAWKAVGPSA